MDYIVDVPERGTYVRVLMQTEVTLSLGIALTRDAVALGARHGLKKMMLDLQGTSSRSSVTDKYDFANRGAEGVGLTREWKIAVLKDEGDETPDFVETAMRNSGYHCRVFADEGVAVRWLEDGQLS